MAELRSQEAWGPLWVRHPLVGKQLKPWEAVPLPFCKMGERHLAPAGHLKAKEGKVGEGTLEDDRC